MESEPLLIPREKSPLPEKKKSSQEDRTHDAVLCRTASPTHYQRAIPLSEGTIQLLHLTELKLHLIRSSWREPPTTSSRKCQSLPPLLSSSPFTSPSQPPPPPPPFSPRPNLRCFLQCSMVRFINKQVCARGRTHTGKKMTEASCFTPDYDKVQGDETVGAEEEG